MKNGYPEVFFHMENISALYSGNISFQFAKRASVVKRALSKIGRQSFLRRMRCAASTLVRQRTVQRNFQNLEGGKKKHENLSNRMIRFITNDIGNSVAAHYWWRNPFTFRWNGRAETKWNMVPAWLKSHAAQPRLALWPDSVNDFCSYATQPDLSNSDEATVARPLYNKKSCRKIKIKLRGRWWHSSKFLEWRKHVPYERVRLGRWPCALFIVNTS